MLCSPSYHSHGSCDVYVHVTRSQLELKQARCKISNKGYLGLQKCLHRARVSVYWPNLTEHLKELVINCRVCLKYCQANCKDSKSIGPPLGQEIPTRPWVKLSYLGIMHITTSPHHHQSNGLAEGYMRIIKNLLSKGKRNWSRLP